VPWDFQIFERQRSAGGGNICAGGRSLAGAWPASGGPRRGHKKNTEGPGQGLPGGISVQGQFAREGRLSRGGPALGKGKGHFYALPEAGKTLAHVPGKNRQRRGGRSLGGIRLWKGRDRRDPKNVTQREQGNGEEKTKRIFGGTRDRAEGDSFKSIQITVSGPRRFQKKSWGASSLNSVGERGGDGG